MKPPPFVRELSDAERQALRAGLRSREGFTLRHAQILLASAEGQRPTRIAAHVGCAIGTVHNTIHAFEKEGADRLAEKKRGPKDARPILAEAKADPLKGLLHQSAAGSARPGVPTTRHGTSASECGCGSRPTIGRLLPRAAFGSWRASCR
jgi:DNA-binding CsgD family transcriptional regulator